MVDPIPTIDNVVDFSARKPKTLTSAELDAHEERILAAAEKYCAAGFRIFVLNGKTPYSGYRWQFEATTNFKNIEDQIRAHRGCNLGLVTGGAVQTTTNSNEEYYGSGIDAFDIDGQEGRDSLDEWLYEHEIHPTMVSRTGSGGYHFLFKHADNLRNSAKNMKPGWDTRGDGGYIVIPPSIHPHTGRTYEWIDFSSPEKIETEFTPAMAAAIPEWPDDLRELYFEVAGRKADQVREEVQRNAGKIPTGMQENTLTAWAGSMLRHGMSLEVITAAMVEAGATQCDPPMTEANARRIANSIGNRQPGDPLITLPLNDTGYANRLVHLARTRLVRNKIDGQWIAWDGKRWDRTQIKDNQQLAEREVEQLAITMLAVASVLPEDTDEEKKHKLAMLQSAKKLHDQRQIETIVKASLRKFSVSPKIFNQIRGVLNVSNGTIDLATGELRNHEPEDYLTNLAEVDYQPEIGYETSKWQTILTDIFSGDTEAMEYFQRFMGYAILGTMSEQVLLIIQGVGGTGKSLIRDLITHILGDYVAELPTAFFNVNQNAEGATPWLSMLEGKHLAVVRELAENQRVDEAKVKQLVGDASSSTRNLYGPTKVIPNTATPLITTNHLPRTTVGRDMKRRYRVLKLSHIFPDDTKDIHLLERLKENAEERSAVLNWLVAGTKAYLEHGLGTCANVEEATAQLFNDEDTMAQWFDDCVEVEAQSVVSATAVFNSYKDWAERNIGPKEQLSRLPMIHKFKDFIESSGRDSYIIYGPHRIPTNAHGVAGGVAKGFKGMRLRDLTEPVQQPMGSQFERMTQNS